ncbi:hypothetical protein RD792_010089 [Penstemon davidsonii]|uniref:Glucosidase 2 subunit beta n=1 Tax=Penstemon davidsonii TaxID=160366 RepID=A0ABR0D205_9LAMI|nr:hypothetical protein RD792_010089 [Penstemon davidsonii]
MLSCVADENYYKVGLSSLIKCKDGSKKFTYSQINDEFCDCPDGSDEPGTPLITSLLVYYNITFICLQLGLFMLADSTVYILYLELRLAPMENSIVRMWDILQSSYILLGSMMVSAKANGLGSEDHPSWTADCCDGSDEYDGKIKCRNTCWEAGKVAREKLMKKIITYQEGVTIRKREIEQAKLAITKEEAELLKLKDEEKILKGLVQQLKERKEQIEKAEEKERLQKEKEEKERMEVEVAKEKESKADDISDDIKDVENDIHDKIGIEEPFQDSTEDHHESVSEPEPSGDLIKEGHLDDDVGEVKEDSLQNSELLEKDSSIDVKAGIDNGNQEKNIPEDAESLSREELGRRVASRWTGEKTEEKTHEEDASVNKDHQNSDETPNETNDEEYNGYDSEEDEHKYEDDDNEESQVDDFAGENHYDSSSSYKPESDDESDFSDSTGSSSSSWLEKLQQTVTGIFRAVNLFQTPVNISDAAHVRKEYDESSAKLSKIESRISSLTQKLKQDFGPEKEFYSFYGKCFEGKQNKSWEKFEDSYRTMQFLNGEKCWNGPDRSLKVKLRCGLKNEVTDVDEPSRCEYLALLSTPALCVDTKLKELQEKLDSLNKQQPQGHDEL